MPTRFRLRPVGRQGPGPRCAAALRVQDDLVGVRGAPARTSTSLPQARGGLSVPVTAVSGTPCELPS